MWFNPEGSGVVFELCCACFLFLQIATFSRHPPSKRIVPSPRNAILAWGKLWRNWGVGSSEPGWRSGQILSTKTEWWFLDLKIHLHSYWLLCPRQEHNLLLHQVVAFCLRQKPSPTEASGKPKDQCVSTCWWSDVGISSTMVQLQSCAELHQNKIWPAELTSCWHWVWAPLLFPGGLHIKQMGNTTTIKGWYLAPQKNVLR